MASVSASIIGQPLTTLHSIPKWLENILDKKVSKTAMNCLERFVHWLCDRLYKAYHEIYIHKTAETVHKFIDGTPLFDKTEEQIAGIKQEQFQTFISSHVLQTHFAEYITLYDKKVMFLTQDIVFCQAAGTKSVTIEDDPLAPGVVKIIEKQLPSACEMRPATNIWHVDLSQVAIKSQTVFGKQAVEEEVYFVLEDVPEDAI